jgi:hypothetical protein
VSEKEEERDGDWRDSAVGHLAGRTNSERVVEKSVARSVSFMVILMMVERERRLYIYIVASGCVELHNGKLIAFKLLQSSCMKIILGIAEPPEQLPTASHDATLFLRL